MMDLEGSGGKANFRDNGSWLQEYGVIVTAGAGAAILNGYAGILTGNNPAFIKQIPDLTGMKSEVLIQRAHRSAWDHQIRTTGAKVIYVETVDDVKKGSSTNIPRECTFRT